MESGAIPIARRIAERRMMAVGAVQSGYDTYLYPAKAKAKEAGADFSSFVAEAAQKPQESMDYQKFMQKKIEELWVKFQNGETEPSYQIGAASFTEKEWDKLLEKFDALQEEIRAQMRQEHEKRAEEQERQAARLAEKIAAGDTKEQTKAVQEGSLLTGTYTEALYPSGKPEEEPVRYITCYTEDGIFCRRAGQTEGYEWSIDFADKGDYNKVTQFLAQFPSDWNMRFASRENFWKDFLEDKIDLDGFVEFLQGTDAGVPDYTVTDGDSVYIDRDKAQWAKYMNQDIGSFYTAQEMEQMQADLIAQNIAKLPKLTGPYENIYRQLHPEYRGERIFCEYPGGPLYTANEIGRKMYENYLQSQMEKI